ncbi:hypothetical protein C7C56_013300 [Massilia glaciei]|uniref:Uncharacterized protein n=1 Tax=Massilia glaciei TaxID=1524097 RepID=A0A2U2HK74_9BURK|nr:hypothetical protein C7C56_013300 [Massilia glaciei]
MHKALLAGVERAPLGAGMGASEELDVLLAAAKGEHLLWQALAANDLWQRAGFTPPALARAAGAAPADPARCPRAAERVLQLILRGIHPELLDQWLALARAARVPLPHACIVPLLEMGMQKPALRHALAPLLGERGNWLAAQNPAWAERYGVSAVAGESVDTKWQLGSIEERGFALEAMRRADPAAALAALEGEWANEPPEHRVTLLPCLATALTLADEAFLERALDDKRKEVRAIAQNLLAGLPGAQLGARCAARLEALFTFGRAAGKLEVRLPDVCTKQMKRDGIGLQTHHGLGEKAGLLLDMVSCVPPAHWSGAWDLPPARVIALFSAHEFNFALLTGLARAAGRALRNTPGEAAFDWFLALIGAGGAGGVDLVASLLPDIELLPPALQESVLQRWLSDARQGREGYRQITHLIEHSAVRQARALSPALSRLALTQAQRQMLHDGASQYSARGFFSVLRLALDAGDCAYLDDNWPADGWEHWPHWRPALDEFKETMHFRHTMQGSFLENDA